MGKLDVSLLRHLTPEHFRLLTAVEMGMKNHELVPAELVAAIAKCRRLSVAKTMRYLCENSLLAYERGKKFDGYRLTNAGYDYLALSALCKRGTIAALGNQIGVGKESDVYIGEQEDGTRVVLKLHKLGRTSFRQVKTKRDYHGRRTACSWLYLSRIAAVKEAAFLKALSDRGLPVPQLVDSNRHIVCMSLVTGVPLCHVSAVDDPARLYDELMCLIVRLAEFGLIHGDLNEFNVILSGGDGDDGNEPPRPVLIDFPQMVSTEHAEAETMFDRDVRCVRDFIRRRFGYESELYPKLDEISKEHNLDAELAASGYARDAQHERQLREGHSDCDDDDNDDDGQCAVGDTPAVDYRPGAERDSCEAEPDSSAAAGHSRNGGASKADRLGVWLDAVGGDMTRLSLHGDCDPAIGAVGELHVDIGDAEEADIGLAAAGLGLGAMPSSALTHVSTVIAPDVVRERARAQAKAAVGRAKTKVKHCAVRRKRHDDKAVINEYKGWDW